MYQAERKRDGQSSGQCMSNARVSLCECLMSSEDPVLSSSLYKHTHIASCSDLTEWKPADGNKDPPKHFIESD